MIHELEGDVTKSDIPGLKILTHIVNTQGAWASGVVVPIGNRWPITKTKYREWYTFTKVDLYDDSNEFPRFMLGNVQFIKTEPDWIVANMLAQKSVTGQWFAADYLPPIRYDSLTECMLRVSEFVKSRTESKVSIVCPWFGTARAGGSKAKIKEMIEEIWAKHNVYIYSYKE